MANYQASPAAGWLDEYGDYLFRYALLRVHSEALAEDLLQETLLAALQSFSGFSAKSSTKTWLTGILKHKILDYFRRCKREVMSIDDNDTQLQHTLFDETGHWQGELTDWDCPEALLNNDQFNQVLQQCLQRLPKQSAQLLILRSLNELSSEECCTLFGYTTKNQLWVALSRIRTRLRQCLDVHWFTQ